MKDRYKKSNQLLKQALEIIPLGSQTFGKCHLQFPENNSPHFIEKGRGAYVWDVDGNRYIDFINALLTVNLGYQDKDVDNAVKKQMKKGVVFSFAHPLEIELSKKVIEMVPCAEMVRFGKNGSDVTTAAIRLARNYTKREHVITFGYHGWQDWFIDTTTMCSGGVPESTKKLVHSFKYNDISSVKKIFNKHKGKIAALIMEPMIDEFPKDGFLQEVMKVTHENGALFILDEIKTGFRFAEGGAQELFNITPDLACLGKGIANGYPLSALVGKKEFMQYIDKMFFSLTNAGEALSLAASLATLNKIQKKKVIQSAIKKGEYLMNEVKKLITKHNLTDILSIKGHPSWSLIIFKDIKGYTADEINMYFMQEIFKRGIIGFGGHAISFAHSKANINRLLRVYDEVFSLLNKELTSGTKGIKYANIRKSITNGRKNKS